MKKAAKKNNRKNLKKEKNSIDYSKGIFAHYHNKLRDEIEFSEADFYEDNIYDDPDYWLYPHIRAHNDSSHEIRR